MKYHVYQTHSPVSPDEVEAEGCSDFGDHFEFVDSAEKTIAKYMKSYVIKIRALSEGKEI